MLRITIALLLTVLCGAAHAHVLGNGDGLVMQLVHQALGAHHLPYMLIAVVVAVVAYRSRRIARK